MFWHRLVYNSFKKHLWVPSRRQENLFMGSGIICSGLRFTHTPKACHLFWLCSESLIPPAAFSSMYEPERRVKWFPLISNLGLGYMNMLMWVQKPHRKDSRWNMSFHLNWWHYWAHWAWKWSCSMAMLIQHWHDKSQSIWFGRLNWHLLLEIIQIRCSQPATRFHPLVSRLHILLTAGESHTFHSFPLHILLRWKSGYYLQLSLHVNTVVVMESVFGWK